MKEMIEYFFFTNVGADMRHVELVCVNNNNSNLRYWDVVVCVSSV